MITNSSNIYYRKQTDEKCNKQIESTH